MMEKFCGESTKIIKGKMTILYSQNCSPDPGVVDDQDVGCLKENSFSQEYTAHTMPSWESSPLID